MKLTFAFCTYKRVDRLPALVAAMRTQACPIPFEILAVNNNSPDNTLDVLEQLSQEEGIRLRYVTEMAQGIVPARNRAIEEALDSDILVFIDDDELPQPGLLTAACDALMNEGAQCVGGRVQVDFTPNVRPAWLGDELLGFLAEVNHGPTGFWLVDESKPIWTSNIAYCTNIFKDDPNLRFDKRYNRIGVAVGGGEDAIMLRDLLARNIRIRYRPDMAVSHFVEPWRINRRYFLKLHYRAGIQEGIFSTPEYKRTIAGIPPFMVRKFLRLCGKVILHYATKRQGSLRQAMTAIHAFGCIVGMIQKKYN